MFEKDVEQRLGIVYAERQLALEAWSPVKIGEGWEG